MIIYQEDNFVLRHATLEDAKILLEIELDPLNIVNMMTYTNNLKDMREVLALEIAEYSKSKPHSEMIIMELDGKTAGYVSIHDLNEKFCEHKAEISYAIHKDFRGKGITSRSVKIITDYAMRKYHLKRLVGWCRTFNEASAKVLKSAGFNHEGTLHKNKCKNGQYLDDMIWAKVV